MTSEFSEDAPKRSDTRQSECPEGAPKHPSLRTLRAEEAYERDDESDHAPPLARPSSEDLAFAVFSHWGGFLAWIIAPWIFYLLQRDRRSLAAWHAREAFNFQLTLTIYYFIDVLLYGLAFIDLWLLLVPSGLILVVLLFELIVVILATIAAAQGRFFRCPLTIPFIRRPSEPIN
jgi:uncharacterized protein